MDALSQLPDLVLRIIAATLPQKITTRFDLEDALIQEIQIGYNSNPFTQKLVCAAPGMQNVHQENGFWFINKQLVMPDHTSLHEALFRLAHNNLGHFGTAKTYSSLRNSFYWLNMCRDLEEGYIPYLGVRSVNGISLTRQSPLVPYIPCQSPMVDSIQLLWTLSVPCPKMANLTPSSPLQIALDQTFT